MNAILPQGCQPPNFVPPVNLTLADASHSSITEPNHRDHTLGSHPLSKEKPFLTLAISSNLFDVLILDMLR